MSEYIVQHDTMVNIANAIRTLTGTEEALSPSQITESVLNKASTTYTVHIGATEPTSDIGVDGDIYIVRSDAT